MVSTNQHAHRPSLQNHHGADTGARTAFDGGSDSTVRFSPPLPTASPPLLYSFGQISQLQPYGASADLTLANAKDHIWLRLTFALLPLCVAEKPNIIITLCSHNHHYTIIRRKNYKVLEILLMVNLSVVFIHIATNVIVLIIMVGLVHTRALNLASAHNTRDPPRIAQGNNKRPAVGVRSQTPGDKS